MEKANQEIKVGSVYSKHHVKTGNVWFNNEKGIFVARRSLSSWNFVEAQTKDEMQEKLANGSTLFCKVKWLKASEVL